MSKHFEEIKKIMAVELILCLTLFSVLFVFGRQYFVSRAIIELQLLAEYQNSVSNMHKRLKEAAMEDFKDNVIKDLQTSVIEYVDFDEVEFVGFEKLVQKHLNLPNEHLVTGDLAKAVNPNAIWLVPHFAMKLPKTNRIMGKVNRIELSYEHETDSFSVNVSGIKNDLDWQLSLPSMLIAMEKYYPVKLFIKDHSTKERKHSLLTVGPADSDDELESRGYRRLDIREFVGLRSCNVLGLWNDIQTMKPDDAIKFLQTEKSHGEYLQFFSTSIHISVITFVSVVVYFFSMISLAKRLEFIGVIQKERNFVYEDSGWFYTIGGPVSDWLYVIITGTPCVCVVLISSLQQLECGFSLFSTIELASYFRLLVFVFGCSWAFVVSFRSFRIYLDSLNQQQNRSWIFLTKEVQ